MKTIHFKIIIVFIGLLLICSGKVNAIEIKEQIKVDDLSKYEMVFLYPEGQETEVENLKNQINEIYKASLDNLIITEKLYDASYCTKRVVADLELQGDIQYKTILFGFINNDMCEHIIYALQNTSASCRHVEGVSRMKVITIPTEEEAKNILNEWKNDKEDWLNYKYEENPSEAINEVYEELNTTKEEFEKAKDIHENGFWGMIFKNDDKLDDVENNINEDENNSGEIVEIGNFEVENKVKEIEVVLADGNIIKPELKDLGSEAKTIVLDPELMHGATLLVHNQIILKNDVDEIKDINLICETNKKYIDSSHTAKVSSNEEGRQKALIENVQLEDGVVNIIIRTSQVMGVGTEIEYENILKEFEYTKIVMEEPEGEEETEPVPVEYREKVECDIKSPNILILSEQ